MQRPSGRAARAVRPQSDDELDDPPLDDPPLDDPPLFDDPPS